MKNKIIWIFVLILCLFLVYSITNVDYNYIYKNLSREVPIYDEICIPTFDAKNLSHIEDCYYNITYKTEYYQNTDVNILERKGVEIDGKKQYGWYSICGDILVQHLVNPGDRNEDEFCRCRNYTIEKGVCREINLQK